MSSPSAASSEVPVTVLTGFLGAGKTTLLNRLLSQPHQARIGVLVNEFGPLGIDTERLAGRQQAVVELLNGCICCASEGDFMRGLNLLLTQQHELDAVLIETSGLADPWPIMRALEQYRFVREVRLWSVVTVVDAEQFDANLERAEAAFQQLTSADLIVINKCDLVDRDVPGLIVGAVRRINAGAKTITTSGAAVPIDLMLDCRVRQPAEAEAHFHIHGTSEFQSTVVRVSHGVQPSRFDDWLSSLGGDIYRMKGRVQFSAEPFAMTFDRVGERCTLRAPIDAGQGVGGTEIAVIGVRLDPAALQAGLEACTGVL